MSERFDITRVLIPEADQSIKRRAEVLDQTRWVNEFSWPEIESLAAYLLLVRASNNATICREGDRDDSLFIIARGTVDIEKAVAAGKTKVIASLGPGQTLGEMSLLDGEPRSATAKASGELLLLSMNLESLDAMIKEKPGLAAKFIWKLARLLSQRLRMTSSNLADRM